MKNYIPLKSILLGQSYSEIQMWQDVVREGILKCWLLWKASGKQKQVQLFVNSWNGELA